MTVWYVEKGSNGSGSEAAPLGTLAAAAGAAQPGDEVIVRPGTYREQLTLATPRVTWRAAEQHKAVLDGGYGWKLGTPRGLTAAPSMPTPGPGHLPTGADAERRGAMVTINAPGVIWEGFCIQNVAGEGVEILEPDVTVRGCAFYCCYSTAIQSNDTAGRNVSDVLIEDCDIVWTSLRTFALGEKEASGAIKTGNTAGRFIIRNVRLWLACGEGFNVGKRTRATRERPFIVEGCTLYDPNHTALYAVQAQNVVFRDNVVVYHENVNPFSKAGTKAGSAGLRIKDENSQSAPVNSRGIRFERNVVVNARLLAETGGDDITQYDCAMIENTLISGPYTLKGVSLVGGSQNQGTEVHWEGNAVHWGRHLNGASMAAGPKTRCTFLANAWAEQPAAVYRGESDRYGALGLVAPDAPVTAVGEAFCDSWAEWQARGLRSTFNLDNYRPVAGGPLDGAGMGALEALPGTPDPEPPEGPEPPEVEPPGANWDSLIERAESIGAHLKTQAAKTAAMQTEIDALTEQCGALRLANETAAMELAELLDVLEEYKAADESGEES